MSRDANTLAAVAADLRKSQVGFFHTHESMDSLQTYIERFSGAEAAVAATVLGVTYNTVLGVVAAELEKEAAELAKESAA